MPPSSSTSRDRDTPRRAPPYAVLRTAPCPLTLSITPEPERRCPPAEAFVVPSQLGEHAPLLSVVIPAFNEEQRIGVTLDALAEYLKEHPFEWEVLVVDDGSTDATVQAVAGRVSPGGRVRVQSVPHRGKGWAVRFGMLAASGRFRLMFDADMAMPVRQIGDFLARMEEGWDIVIGSREASGAVRSGESFARHLRGRTFNRAVSLLVVSGYRDTQCGFKCFRGEVADRIFKLQRTRGLAFDVEVLYLARRMGLEVLEMPIGWRHDRESRIRPFADSLEMLRDAALIRLRDVCGFYKLG